MILLIVSILPTLVSSAFVQTYSCNENLKTLQQDHKAFDLLRSPVALVSIRDGYIYYRLDFSVTAEINDVNYTTNLFTTLNVESTFMNEQVFKRSVRLCEFVRPVTDGLNSSDPLNGIPPPPNNGELNPNSTDGDATGTHSNGDGDKNGGNGTNTRVPWPSASGIPPLISKRSIYKKQEGRSAGDGHPDGPAHGPAHGQGDGQGDGQDEGQDEGQDDGPAGSACPLVPGKRYEILFGAPIERARYFGFYETTFTFLGADYKTNNEIGCFQIYATPYHPTYITYPICFGVMAIFIFGFITNFYIFHFSPNQESDNVFLTVASSICNGPLLNELTPDITMLLNFLQFFLFSCALNLTYPGFLQPIVSYLNWVALIRVDIFSSEFINALSENGVYKSLGRLGIYGIFPENFTIPDGETSSNIWKNFMVWSWCVVAFFIILHQLFIAYKQHFTKNYQISGWKSRFYFTIGCITQFFYEIFALPFVSFSCFLILGLAKSAYNVQFGASIICILFLIAWLVGICFFSFKYVILQKHLLYSSFKVISCWSSLYHWYKPECSYYLIIKKFIVLFQGLVIGFAQSNGTVQVSLLIFMEIIQILSLLYIQPYFNKTRNIWGVAISFASLVIISLNIAFIRDLYVSTRIQGLIGDVQLVICLVVILAFLSFFIIRVIQVVRSKMKKEKVNSEIDEKSGRHNSQRSNIKYHGKNTESENDTTLEPEPEFEFEAPSDYHNFPRERTGQPHYHHHHHHHYQNQLQPLHSRPDSTISEDSSVVELTDQRVLPGISLKYLNSKEYLPAPVSPINDEFLANLSKDDSELRKLWAKRNNFKGNSSSSRNLESDCENGSILNLKRKKTSIENTRGGNANGGGFQVVGRKPIVVKSAPTSKTHSPAPE